MNKKKTTLVNAAMAGILAAGAAATISPAVAAPTLCFGINSCKGRGECAGPDSSCKGANDCKGKGSITTASAEKCKDLGGKVVGHQTASTPTPAPTAKPTTKPKVK